MNPFAESPDFYGMHNREKLTLAYECLESDYLVLYFPDGFSRYVGDNVIETI